MQKGKLTDLKPGLFYFYQHDGGVSFTCHPQGKPVLFTIQQCDNLSGAVIGSQVFDSECRVDYEIDQIDLKCQFKYTVSSIDTC
jgi:hypothetical protein